MPLYHKKKKRGAEDHEIKIWSFLPSLQEKEKKKEKKKISQDM